MSGRNPIGDRSGIAAGRKRLAAEPVRLCVPRTQTDSKPTTVHVALCMNEPPPEPCRSMLGDAVRPLMAEAGDTYDMGGGYFL